MSACINYTTQGIYDPCLKSLLSESFFCVLRGLIPRRTTLKFEYLREFEPEFEKVLGYELGAHMGSIHEINQRQKISCYCTFKVINGIFSSDAVGISRQINFPGSLQYSNTLAKENHIYESTHCCRSVISPTVVKFCCPHCC